MRQAIMQPYLFPYIGYWQIINYVDEWIFFDVVKYNRKTWMNRNRILHPDQNKEFQYISLPIKKHDKGTLIKDVLINNDEKWKEKILGQLTVYKKLKAPYYEDIIQLIASILHVEYSTCLSLTIESTKQLANFLDIDFKYKIASKIDFDKSEIKAPGDWALTISKHQGATKYINPYSGYEIFDEEKYQNNNIDLLFLKPHLSKYRQSWRKNFIKGLSIIDLLMFNSKEEVKALIDGDFTILDKKQLIKELEKS